jgi:putative membrane protein
MRRNMKFRQIVLIGVVVLLALVAIQNTEVVSLRFIFWELSMSRVLLVLFTALGGFLGGYIVGRSHPI